MTGCWGISRPQLSTSPIKKVVGSSQDKISNLKEGYCRRGITVNMQTEAVSGLYAGSLSLAMIQLLFKFLEGYIDWSDSDSLFHSNG